uniref:Uncharacterized protein n=1 Tax=Oryza punctata TaxID=4537 RepID=A0A0E0LYX4_ORYPU
MANKGFWSSWRSCHCSAVTRATRRPGGFGRTTLTPLGPLFDCALNFTPEGLEIQGPVIQSQPEANNGRRPLKAPRQSDRAFLHLLSRGWRGSMRVTERNPRVSLRWLVSLRLRQSCEMGIGSGRTPRWRGKLSSLSSTWNLHPSVLVFRQASPLVQGRRKEEPLRYP